MNDAQQARVELRRIFEWITRDPTLEPDFDALRPISDPRANTPILTPIAETLEDIHSMLRVFRFEKPDDETQSRIIDFVRQLCASTKEFADASDQAQWLTPQMVDDQISTLVDTHELITPQDVAYGVAGSLAMHFKYSNPEANPLKFVQSIAVGLIESRGRAI